ncbi:amino acid ABC transporter permease [Sinanaerobacter chloroacetimidivorans]|uniref:Amino acid ABC transporter permease n=1 Tax=Sinanaerobacter chloroacetimidivorans TaxID=2818044 RepID=A0A8J7W0T7_9FIRM|nr:amino acid ABC transporter permease [Sinanaerobacter chloroacetimidivorans]MBR0597138.1 amino acid ABC transporter permease [Sinanaerobacter chloroacetimidivorans]
MEIYLKGIKIAYSGISVTMQITIFAVLLGVIIGLFVALGKMSQNKVVRGIFSVYVEILRGTPLVVQVLIMYYGIPMLLLSRGFEFKWENPVIAAILVCGINSSAYVAEIIRSGLQAVDKGQMEAARSLGMNHVQAMRFIIIPQAFRIILPALANEFIALLKETAILSVIAIEEVTRKSMLWAAATFDAWPAYLGTAFVYLTITIPLSRIVAYMERRMAQSDRGK